MEICWFSRELLIAKLDEHRKLLVKGLRTYSFARNEEESKVDQPAKRRDVRRADQRERFEIPNFNDADKERTVEVHANRPRSREPKLRKFNPPLRE